MRKRLIILLVFLPAAFLHGREEARFDGKRAYGLLKKQCSFGFRIPGTPEAAKCADFIERELERLDIKVERDPFRASTTLLGSDVQGVNIIGIYQGDNPSSDLLALSAHWDTRSIAEKDPDPGFRETPILGANDGASGVALLLELARVLKKRRYPGRVLFLFFDIEDSGLPGQAGQWCLGSRHFARSRLSRYPVTAGINFDMIGDRDLKIRPEKITLALAGEMAEAFWRFAELRAPFHFSSDPLSIGIMDDHEPFLKQGIPYINLIDFDYPWWHTQEDTPDKCSPISLQIVGNVAVEYIFERWKKLQNNP